MEPHRNSYKENKAIYKQMKADGKLEKNHWYLVKGSDDVLKSKLKEDLIRILRTDAVSSHLYYFEYNGYKPPHRL